MTVEAEGKTRLSKGRWYDWLKWSAATVVSLAALVVAYVAFSDDVDFEVMTQNGYEGAQGFDRQLPLMSIQSHNDEKIVVKRVLINNDDKCLPTFKSPLEMALGDKFRGHLPLQSRQSRDRHGSRDGQL